MHVQSGGPKQSNPYQENTSQSENIFSKLLYKQARESPRVRLNKELEFELEPHKRVFKLHLFHIAHLSELYPGPTQQISIGILHSLISTLSPDPKSEN